MAELLSNKPIDVSTGLTDKPNYSTTARTREEQIQDVMATPLQGGPAARGVDIDLEKYQPYLGHVNISSDINEARAQNQSVGEQIAYGTGRLVGTTATKLFQGLGYAATALPSLALWDADIMLDNGFSAMFAQGEEYMKDEMMPIYHTNAYKQGNVLQQMGTFGFWADDVVDGAAFMISNIIGAKGVGALGKSVGAYGKLAKTFTQMSRAVKTGKAIKGAANLKKWTDTMEVASMSLYNSVTEAAFEAKDLKDSLMRQGLGNDEASASAMNAFWLNVGVLMGPNMITNSMIFKPFRASKGGMDKLFKDGKLVKENLKALGAADMAGAFAKNAAISIGSEGLWEENIQLAIQNYETGRALGTDDRHRLVGLAEEWVNNFTTDEGQKAMVLGAIIGLIPGGFGGMKQAQGEQQQAIEMQQMMQLTEAGNQAALDSYLVKKEGSATEYELDKNGKPMLNIPMIKDMWEQKVRGLSNAGNSLLALEADNKLYYDFLLEERMASIAVKYMGHPDGEELFKLQLDTIMEQELELIEKTGNTELEEGIRRLKSKYEQRASEYKNMYDAVVNNYTAFLDYGDTQEAFDYKNKIASKLLVESINQNYWQGVKNEAEADISKVTGSNRVDTELGKAEIARSEKIIEGVNSILQKSERAFRDISNKKNQNEGWVEIQSAKIEQDIAQEEDINTPVIDTDGNISTFVGQEDGLYTFEVDEEGNLEKLTEKEVKLRGMRDADGDFIVDPDKLIDEDGNGWILEGKKGGKYIVRDTETNQVGEATEEELKTLKFEDETLGTVEEEIIQRDKKLVALIAAKYDAIKDRLKTREGKAAKAQLDKELVEQLGTHKYDNQTFAEVFDKAGITGEIPVIHRGVLGDMSRSASGAKIIFKPYSGGQEIKFMAKSKKTLVQNAIFVYSSYTFDLSLSPNPKHVRSIAVNGVILSNYHRNPLNAIIKDKEGNPVAIRLWKGNSFVCIKNQAIVADLAVAIPMMEEARAKIIDYIKVSDESFVMVKDPKSLLGKYYPVYFRNGEYVVANSETGKRYKDVVSARILDEFFVSLEGRIIDFQKSIADKNEKNEEITKQDIKDELREFDNIIRQATPEEINASKSAAEVQGANPETRDAQQLPDEQEVEAGKKVEEEIIDDKAKKAAKVEAEVEIVQEAEKAQEGPIEANLPVEPVNDSELPPREQTAIEEADREGVNPANTIAYAAAFKPVFNDWISDKKNRLEVHEAHFFIDYKGDKYVRDFWNNNPEAKAKMQKGILTDAEIDALLAMPDNKKFNNLVDLIPIKVVLKDKDGKAAPGEDLYLHETPFKTKKARERTPEEVADVRKVRRTILKEVLKGNNPIITDIRKTKGQFQNRPKEKGKERNDLITNVFKNIKLSAIKLGVAKGVVGRILRGTNGNIPGKGNAGNIFMSTTETCNGEEATIKLNSIKLTDEHAKILLRAMINGNSKGVNRGFAAQYDGPGVENLTNLQVINMLVLEGKKYTQQSLRTNPKPHLEAKQLWADASNVYYGEQDLGTEEGTDRIIGQISLNQKKRTQADINAFIAWAKGNKNYVIDYSRLGKQFKSDFKLGRLIGTKGESYEAFTIRNGFVKTDLDPNQPFTAPVVIFDIESLVSSSTKVKDASTTVTKTVSETPVTKNKTVTKRQYVNVKFSDPSKFAGLPIGTIIYLDEEGWKETDKMEGEKLKIEVRTEWFRVVYNKAGDKILKNTAEATSVQFKRGKAFEGVTLDNVEQLQELLYEFEWEQNLLAADINVTVTETVKEKVAPEKIESPKVEISEEAKETGIDPVDPLSMLGEDNFYRLAPKGLKAYKYIDVYKATKWLRNKLPAGEVKWLDDVIKVGDSVAYGQFSRDVITLSKKAEEGTEYHEAYHRISLGFLTDTQRKALYAEARIKYDLQDKKDNAVEEYLAEKFREYTIVKNKESWLKKATKLVKSLFRRLTDFLTITEKQEPKDIESVFAAINEGYYKVHELLVDNEYVKGPRTFLQDKYGYSSDQISEVVKSLVFIAFKVNKISNFDDVTKLKFGAVKKKLVEMQTKFAVAKNETRAANYQAVIDQFDYWQSLVSSYLLSFKIGEVKTKEVAGEGHSDGTELSLGLEAATNDFARHDQASYESNFKDNVLASIKMLIMTLHEEKTRGEILGLPKFADFNATWNRIMVKLHNADTITEMLDILDDTSESDEIFKRLSTRLKKGTDEVRRTQFEISVKRAKHDFIDLTYEEDANGRPLFQFQNTDTQRASKKFVRQWSEAFYASDFFVKDRLMGKKVTNITSKFMSLEDEVVTEYDKQGSLSDVAKNIRQTATLLNELGMGVDSKVVENLVLSRNNVTTLDEGLKLFLMLDLPHFFGDNGILQRRLNHKIRTERGVKIKDNELFLDEKVVGIIAQSYVESKPEELSVTVLGPASNPYFIYAPNNYVTDSIRAFKKDDDRLKELLGTVSSKNSYILNQLLGKSKDERSTFNIRTFSGFIQKGVGDVGRDYLGLNEAEDFLFKLTAIHKGFKHGNPQNGFLPMPTLADRKTYYLYDGVDILDHKLDIVDGELVLAKDSEVVDVFRKYAEDERNRIKLVKDQIATAIKTKDSSNLVEGLHYVIKTDAQAKSLINGPKAKYEEVDTDIVKLFVDKHGTYYGNGAKYQHFKSFENPDAWKNPDKEIKLGLRHITDSTIEYAAELGIITITRAANGRPIIKDNKLLDPKLVSKVANEEFNGNRIFAIKRIIGNYAVNTMMSVIETEKMLSGDVANYKGMTAKEINEDKIKRLTVLTSTGDNLRTTFPPSHELHGKTEYTVSTLNTSMLNSAYHEGLLEKHTEIIKRESEEDFKEGKIDKVISDTKAAEVAKLKLFKYGHVDQTDAQVYISPTMYRSLLIRLGEWSPSKQKAFNILQSDTAPTLEQEKQALSLLMPPLKFVHYALYAKNGLAVPIFDKMSMAPLFKRFVKDTNLEELYNRMELVGKYGNGEFEAINMVKFDSAVKVGNTERVNYYKDKNPTIVRDMYTDMLPMQSQKFEYLRRQLLTDPHDVERSLFGTQVKKLGMSNVVKGKDYKVGNKTMKGEALTTEWTELLKDFSNMGKETLLKRLGVTRNNETDSYQISDPRKLMEMLREDAISSGMPDNIVDALRVVMDNKLYMTIDALPERKWIYNRLISLVSKHTVDIELPGNAFIQMTNFGLDKMSDEEADVKNTEIEWLDDSGNKRIRPLKFYGLSEDGGVTPMECYVSINLFKRIIPNYENLTWAEKKAWVKKNPEIMGWRIPTQGLNSISHLKVVGLLPEQLGDTIILPAEFTALTGSDFDIDKLFVARYNYDENGELIEYKKGMKNSKKGMENRLLDMYKAVITSPHHYTQVTTPLDAATKLVKDIHGEVIKLRGENKKTTPPMWELSPRYQAEVKSKYTGGKGGIGPFALGNAHHPLGQIAGLALKMNMGIGNTVEIDGETVTDLAQTKDVNGEYILDWMSALINAHVDVAKDPYILELNVNATTYGMTNLLVRAGVGNLAFWFMPQPVLVDLAKESATQKGKIISKKGRAGTIIRKEYVVLYEKALRREGKKFTDAGYKEKRDNTRSGAEQMALAKEIWVEKTLAGNIKEGARPEEQRSSEYYKRQLDVLEEYQRLNWEAQNLNEVVMASRIDTKQYGSNLSEIVGFVNRYRKMWKDNKLHNTDKLFKDTFLATLFENSIQLSKDLFGQLTITGTKEFQDALTRLLQMTGNGYTIDNKYINFVSDELFAAISSKFFIDDKNILADSSKVKKLFYGDKGLVAQINKIKNGQLHPELEHNRLINLLKADMEIDTGEPNKLTLHSTNIKEKWDRDEIVRSWSDILNFTSEDAKKQTDIRSLGRSIVLYAFYSSGFNKTLTSFYDFIPNEWLEQSGYSDYMTGVLESFKDGTNLGVLYQAMDEIFVNNWSRTKYNTAMTTKPLVPSIPFGESVKALIVERGQAPTAFQLEYDMESDYYMGTNERNEPIYSPYLTDVSKRLFKYIGYDRTTKNAVYKVVPMKKGHYDRGFVIKEYFLETSVMEDNNANISAEAMKNTDNILNNRARIASNDFYGDIEVMSLHSLSVHDRNGDALKQSSTQADSESSEDYDPLYDKVHESFNGFYETFLSNSSYLYNLDIKLNTKEREAARQNLIDNDRTTKQAQDLYEFLENAYETGTIKLLPISAGGLSVREGGSILRVKPVMSEEMEQQERYKKFLAESPFATQKSKANIPQNLVSGQEAFGTKQEATPFVKSILGNSPHSIDMIAAGLRTRTTRSIGEMEKYNIKIGDTITHVGKSADGTTKRIKAYVTDIYPKGSKEYTSTWDKEGWAQEGVKSIERYKDGAAAIEFALEPDTIFSTEPFQIWNVLDKHGKSFSELSLEAQQDLRDKYKHCK